MRQVVAADDRPTAEIDRLLAEVGDLEPLRVALALRELGVEHDLGDHDRLLTGARAPGGQAGRAPVAEGPRRRRRAPVLAECVVGVRIGERHRGAVGIRERPAVVPSHTVDLHAVKVGDDELVAVVVQTHPVAVREVDGDTPVVGGSGAEHRVPPGGNDDGVVDDELVVVVVLDRVAGHVDRLGARVVHLEPLTGVVARHTWVLEDLGDDQRMSRQRAAVGRTGAAEVATRHDRGRSAPTGAVAVVEGRVDERHRAACGHGESVGAVVHDVTFRTVGVAQHEEVVGVPQDDRVAVDVVGGDASITERVAVPREQCEFTRFDDDRRQHDVVVDLVADRPPLEVGRFVASVVELDPLATRVVGAVRVDHQLVDDHVGPAIGAHIGRAVERGQRGTREHA